MLRPAKPPKAQPENPAKLRVVTRADDGFPAQLEYFPRARYMGNKTRLLGWIHSVLRGLEFESAADVFCGSTSVSYLLKAMGKRVHSADFLNFPSVLAGAFVANSDVQISEENLQILLRPDRNAKGFVQETFAGIFYTPDDLAFLDLVSWNIRKLPTEKHRNLARAALVRSCLKRQPRGVFTISDPGKYQDGRRDLSLSIRDHFIEQLVVCNAAIFDNGTECKATREDVFNSTAEVDLVYMDPPYVPRSDDNCYIKRYHFLEGISCYWENCEILQSSKVRKIKKPFTPFSYRKTAEEAFDGMFKRFARSKLVLSYSSNGYPDLERLVELMGRYKHSVEVYSQAHTYTFGNHAKVERNEVEEYLIVGA